MQAVALFAAGKTNRAAIARQFARQPAERSPLVQRLAVATGEGAPVCGRSGGSKMTAHQLERVAAALGAPPAKSGWRFFPTSRGPCAGLARYLDAAGESPTTPKSIRACSAASASQSPRPELLSAPPR